MVIDINHDRGASKVARVIWPPCLLALAALLVANAAIAAPLACVPAPPDLGAWWSGEDNAFDRLGNYPGSLTNGVGYGPGFVGRAFQFDGIDDSMRVGLLGGIGLTETGPFTIAAWVNTRASDLPALQVIAGNYMGEGGGIGNFSLYLRIDSGNLLFAINQRQLADTYVNTAIANGWHLVVATYDGSVMALYVDGELRGSTPRTFSGSTPNTRGWNIGNFSDETNSAHGFNSSFNGLIDEVALFSRMLSAGEISSIFNAGGDGICTPTIFADGFESD
ncbi:MAG: LamG domain-containing protein [Xanthomonadales bacterium]|nr:LamG domain-containing protein [Xanthomonadales bacterium]